MPSVDRIIVCGGLSVPPHSKDDQIVVLDLGGNSPNVNLEITNITRPLSSDVPDVLVDLIEVASYVYCADQAVTRGGDGTLAFGGNWRRPFRFHIPVRCPDTWSSKEVTECLRTTLSVLSDDEYDFRFKRQVNPAPMQRYLKLADGDSGTSEVDDVLLFSGGLDSLGGAVQEAVRDKRRVALVSHRSNAKIHSRQKQLVEGLRALCPKNPPVHVPVWVHKDQELGREFTQRTRSFLYAALAIAVARVFGLKRIRFYENGVMSLNLPISEQAVGARATRTTHPQVLNGFADLFGILIQEPFAVENPFLWTTKAEAVDLIGRAGCGELIGHSVSCMHTRGQTIEQPHCGRCSQCISRRFGTLASGYAECDPQNMYKVDLLVDERKKGVDLTLVESFIRNATEIRSMSDFQLIERYGEISRVLRHVQPLTADQVADRVVRLHKKHAEEVCGVMDRAIAAHATEIREGELPPSCAIILAVPEEYRKKLTPRRSAEQPESPQGGVPVAERRPGRKANVEVNSAVARVLKELGDDWRDRLDDVCDALNRAEIPLPASKKWRNRRCNDWLDVLSEDKEGLVKALQHRLDWASRNHSDMK